MNHVVYEERATEVWIKMLREKFILVSFFIEKKREKENGKINFFFGTRLFLFN